MKKVLLILLVAIFAIPSFQACKKGKNDPTISLKSRKSRLVAEWKLIEGMRTIINGGTTVTITYNGSTQVQSTGFTGVYTQTVVIEKDGTFKITIFDDGDLTVMEGQWYFMGANKDNEIKDKQCVAFVVTQETYTPAGGTASIWSYVSVEPDIVWQLDKLSSKELIVFVKEIFTGTTTNSDDGTYTYEAS